MDLVQKETSKSELPKDPASATGEHAVPLVAPTHTPPTNAFANSQETKEEKKSETTETAKRLNSEARGREGIPSSRRQQ